MKYCFIINPASGKPETKADLENKIREAARLKGLDTTVMYTEKAGDAGDFIVSFAEKNEGEDIRFYACGGDGTLCEAVNGVMRLADRSRVSLGVVPVGTGNDFVRSFECGELFHDIGAQMDAEYMDVDLMKCNDSYAINMINIGFDCQVVVKTAIYKKKKFIPSKMAYICGLVATLIKKPGVAMSISADGGEEDKRECLLTTFAKGNFCGGGFNSNPEARLVDGRINALVVKNVTRRRFLSLVGSYKKGTHLCEKNSDILHSEKALEYVMNFDGDTNISIDGEIMSARKIHLSCIEGAIRFLVPRGASYAKGLASARKETATV